MAGGIIPAAGLTVASLNDQNILGDGSGHPICFYLWPFRIRPKNPEGELDVMVVGGPNLVEMDQIISKAEEELKRGISLMSLKVREFRERAKVKDGFVARALSRPRIMLIGNEREMAGLLA